MQSILNFILKFLYLFTVGAIIDPWEEGLRVRLGKWIKPLKPGFHFKLPFAIDQIYTVNVKPQIIDVVAQSLETLDGVSVVVVGAIEYSVEDIKKLHLNIQDYDESLVNLGQILIAEYVTSSTNEDCTRESIQKAVKRRLKDSARKWGINIRRFGITDLAEHKVYRILSNSSEILPEPEEIG